MSEQHEKVKARIRKLLNLAEGDGASDGEIENAMRMAQQMMDAHHISERDLEESEIRAGMDTGRAWCGGKRSAWECTLAFAVETLIGSIGAYWDRACHRKNASGFVDWDSPARVSIVFYGPAEDVALAVSLFEEMQHTIATMAAGKFGGVYRGAGREYAEGFAVSLARKAQEVKRAGRDTAQDGTAVTAIVLRTKALAKQWLKEEKKITLRSGGSLGGGGYDGNARAEGRKDGAAFSAARRGRLGSGRKALPGS